MRRCLLLSSFLCVLPAQSFIVDAANGPGANFTDLATAVAAVPDGALLFVRPGQYASFAIVGKSLTILADVGVGMLGPGNPNVTIQSLAVGQRVVIRGLAAAAIGGGRTTYTCQGCAGEIVLDHVGGMAYVESRLVVTQCAQVVVTHGVFASNPAAGEITNSDVTLIDCTLMSGHNSVPGAPLQLQPGVTMTGGRLQLTNSVVSGVGNILATNPPAVSMQGGTLRADGGSWLRSDFGFVPGLAIAGTGTARLDPTVALFGAQPLVASTVAVSSTDLPSARAAGGDLGGNASATMTGGSSTLGVLWIGLPGPAVAMPGSGDPLAIWNGIVQAVGMLSAPLVASVPVPNTPSLSGAAFGWQGLAFDASGSFELTNAAPFALH